MAKYSRKMQCVRYRRIFRGCGCSNGCKLSSMPSTATLNTADAQRLQTVLDGILEETPARWSSLDQLRYFCDGAGASLLDEGTAAAEAMMMCVAHHRHARTSFFVSSDCHPQTIEVIRTRAGGLGIDVVIDDLSGEAAPPAIEDIDGDDSEDDTARE